jgi:hypothetical protein
MGVHRVLIGKINITQVVGYNQLILWANTHSVSEKPWGFYLQVVHVLAIASLTRKGVSNE